MIGFVSPELRPYIRLTLRGPNGTECKVDGWVDTGFDGAMVLPQNVIDDLALMPDPAITIQLADGSQVEMQTYKVIVLWEGNERHVHVVPTQGFILIGLHLFHRHHLDINFTDGGMVTIEPLN